MIYRFYILFFCSFLFLPFVFIESKDNISNVEDFSSNIKLEKASVSEFSGENPVFVKNEEVTEITDIPKKHNFHLIEFLIENYDLESKKAEDIVELVNEASLKYNIPKEIIFGIIHVESTFQQYSKSEFGAMGLMQIVPKYHKKMIKEEFGANVSDLFVPEINIFAGTKILADSFKKTNNISRSLKLYNGNLSENSYYDKKVLKIAKKFEEIKK